MTPLPEWTRNGDSFWRRHPELQTLAEETIAAAVEEQCGRWLQEFELEAARLFALENQERDK